MSLSVADMISFCIFQLKYYAFLPHVLICHRRLSSPANNLNRKAALKLSSLAVGSSKERGPLSLCARNAMPCLPQKMNRLYDGYQSFSIIIFTWAL